MADIENTRRELNRMLDMEEAMWHKRTHIAWLKQGNRNTSFFHTKASSRYQHNILLVIINKHGVWQEDVKDIGNVFLEYYESLFTSSNPTVSVELLDAIHPKVSAHMNSILTREFRVEEVDRALKQMSTALRPDEMPPSSTNNYGRQSVMS